MSRGKLVLYKDRCKGCGLCITVCKYDVLALSPETNAVGYPPVEVNREENCTGCALCAWMCPDLVIEVERRLGPDEKADKR